MPLLDPPFDAIIADMPYGTTQNEWDSVLQLSEVWLQYKRLIKSGGGIVLTATQPFTSELVMSNKEWFKWEDVWRKSHATGHLNCKVMPLRQHENILVFGEGRITYNPQIEQKPMIDVRPSRKSAAKTSNYGAYHNNPETTIPLDMSYPRSVLEINSPNHGEKGLHPNQKPFALMAYLIRTYTNPEEIVLDNTMGSGTTLAAAQDEGRQAVGIELSEEYCKIAVERLRQPSLFTLPSNNGMYATAQPSLPAQGSLFNDIDSGGA